MERQLSRPEIPKMSFVDRFWYYLTIILVALIALAVWWFVVVSPFRAIQIKYDTPIEFVDIFLYLAFLIAAGFISWVIWHEFINPSLPYSKRLKAQKDDWRRERARRAADLDDVKYELLEYKVLTAQRTPNFFDFFSLRPVDIAEVTVWVKYRTSWGGVYDRTFKRWQVSWREGPQNEILFGQEYNDYGNIVIDDNRCTIVTTSKPPE